MTRHAIQHEGSGGRDTSLSSVGRRIHVVGTTGSGKTTLARQLSQCLGIPHIELDALHWDADWTPAPTHVFRERTARALAGEAWVVDGNYSKVRDIVWSRADTVVWLDYALPLILWRLVRRTFRRVVTQEELWNSNRERLREQLFSRDSLFLWALRTYRRRRREYPVLFNRPEHARLTIVHLRSPQETQRWLGCITRSAALALANTLGRGTMKHENGAGAVGRPARAAGAAAPESPEGT